MDGVVVSELGSRKSGIPGILAIVTVASEHIFKGPVSTLGLAVRLGVMGGGHG